MPRGESEMNLNRKRRHELSKQISVVTLHNKKKKEEGKERKEKTRGKKGKEERKGRKRRGKEKRGRGGGKRGRRGSNMVRRGERPHGLQPTFRGSTSTCYSF